MPRKKKITEANGFAIGTIVVIENADVFIGPKAAVVTDICKWDPDGIVCSLTDDKFPFRDIVIFPGKEGHKIQRLAK
jgi:hypothetical protein